MCHRFQGLGLLLGLVLLVPAFAADDKKPTSGKDKEEKTPHIDSDKLPAGPYTGKLQNVPDKDGTFTLQVDTTRLEAKNPNQPNRDNNQAVQAITRDEAHIAQLEADLAVRNLRDYAHKSQQLDTALAKLQKQIQQSQVKLAKDFKTVVDHKLVDFKLADEVKVRILELPTQFDDEGKVKTYSEDERKALKGKDSNLPGFEAKLSDLKADSILRVSLAKKPAPAESRRRQRDNHGECRREKDPGDGPRDLERRQQRQRQGKREDAQEAVNASSRTSSSLRSRARSKRFASASCVRGSFCLNR